MTDKQIIIDGIDVSGCEWFYKNDPCKNTCKYFCTSCGWVSIQNCMFKCAKRKEQECEELKAKFELFKTSNQTTIDQLKAENETLFKAIEKVNKINKRLESENEELKKQLESTKGLVTVGNRQLAEALKELQTYKDKEQKEKEVNEKLYKKLEGSCLIGKHWRFK